MAIISLLLVVQTVAPSSLLSSLLHCLSVLSWWPENCPLFRPLERQADKEEYERGARRESQFIATTKPWLFEVLAVPVQTRYGVHQL